MATIINSTQSSTHLALPGSFTHITRDGLIEAPNVAVDLSAGGQVLPHQFRTMLSVDGTLLSWLNKDDPEAERSAVIRSTHSEFLNGDAESYVPGAEHATIRIGETGVVVGASFHQTYTMDGVSMVSGQQLHNAGDINAAGSGVIMEGSSITVENSGTIRGIYNAISDADAENNSIRYIHNAGWIIGGIDGIYLTGGTDFIENTGTISAPSNAIFVGANSTIVNSGTIVSLGDLRAIGVESGFDITNHGLVQGTVSSHDAANGTLFNSGTMSSQSVAVDFSFPDEVSNVEIENTGTIQGAEIALTLGAGNDKVINSGELHGTVELDDADDISNDTLENSGTILGDVQFHGGNDLFRNTGDIEGIVDLGLGNDQGYNTGSIIGSVTLGYPNEVDDVRDVFVNQGLVAGTVSFGSGDDAFDGRGGHVYSGVFGGDGDDVYIIDNPLDGLHEFANQGIDLVQTEISYKLNDHFENLELLGLNDLEGIGNSQSNRITGNSSDNRLIGRQGNDTLAGGEGDDDLRGSNGNDSLLGDDGLDQLRGGQGADTLIGGLDDDWLSGGSGADSLNGGDGDDTLMGGRDSDTLLGGLGEDSLTGGGGDDTLQGGASEDWLHGGGADDRLIGGAGDDTLVGGLGADWTAGGSGSDTFVYLRAKDSGTSASDTVVGFAKGEDVLDLSRVSQDVLVFNTTGSFSGSGVASAFITEAGGNSSLFVDVNGNGTADMQILLTNVVGIGVDDMFL